jgi:nucleoside-diphosphate-sugar epimerase
MINSIAITGSSGFIGTYFIKRNIKFNITEIDLLTCPVDQIIFSNIDSVLHLAALVHQMEGADDEQYTKINRDLAFEVAKRAKAYGVKQFVLMSTSKVYGEFTESNLSWNESSICNPSDSYGKSKLEAENLIMSIADVNFKVAIVRSPLVYGPGVKGNMISLLKLIDKIPILPLGGIENSRSMVYIGNLVALLESIIITQSTGIFIAGDRVPLSTTELVQIIGKNISKRVLLFKMPLWLLKGVNKIKPAFISRLFGSFLLDNSTTNTKLGFFPPYSSNEGIQEMVEWYRSSKPIIK